MAAQELRENGLPDIYAGFGSKLFSTIGHALPSGGFTESKRFFTPAEVGEKCSRFRGFREEGLHALPSGGFTESKRLFTPAEVREKGYRALFDWDFTESKRYFTLAVHESPSPSPKEAARALVGLANAKIALGEYEGAAADCTKAIEFDENYWRAHYYLGLSSLKMEDLEAARQALSKGEEWAHLARVADKFQVLLSEIEVAETLINIVPGDNASGNNADVEAGADGNQPWIRLYTKELSTTDATKTLSLRRTKLDPLFNAPGREFPACDILHIFVQIEDGEPDKLVLRRRPTEYTVYWKKFIAAKDEHKLEQHRRVKFSYKWRVVSTVETFMLRVSRIPEAGADVEAGDPANQPCMYGLRL